MSESIKIGIAEDHLFVRQGLISLLKEFPEIEVIFDVANGVEVLENLKSHKIDIILLDIEMPIMDGSDVFEKIKFKYPSVKVIVITSHYKHSYIIEFVKKGAAGFLSKTSPIEKIVTAITSVYKDGYYFDSGIALIMAKTVLHSIKDNPDTHKTNLNLTRQEVFIIRLICSGKSSAEIAKTLFISIRTVDGHRLHIGQKTHCKNQTELTIFAIQNNLVNIS